MLVNPDTRTLLAATNAGTGTPPEVAGTPIQPDLVLPSGIHLRLHRFNGLAPTRGAVAEAVRGILQLPAADQQLIAKLRIPVELIPVEHLEQTPGTTMPVVGATRVSGPDGSARVERIRIATLQAALGTRVEECVQHELGHVVGVTRHQDLGEAFAEGYAARY